MSRVARFIPLGVLGGGGDTVATNLPAALNSFNAAMASGTKRGLVYVIGDSIGMGYNATGEAGWVSMLNTYLQAKYAVNPEPIPGSSVEWTKVGDWALSTNIAGPFTWYNTANALQNNGIASNVENETLSITKTCNAFNLYYYHFNDLGMFKVSIDGGAEADIDDGAAGNGRYCKTYAFEGAAAAHTISIRVPSGKYCWIHALDPITSGGVSTFNKSVGSTGITSTRHLPTEMPLLYAQTITDTVNTEVLFILSLTQNDYGLTQTAINTFTILTTTLVDYLKTKGDVLLLAENHQAAALTIPQVSYDNVYKTLAVGNVGCIRVAKKWETSAQAIAAGYVDEVSGVHPNDIGHADYAALVEQFI